MVCIQPENKNVWDNKNCRTIIMENNDGTVNSKC